MGKVSVSVNVFIIVVALYAIMQGYCNKKYAELVESIPLQAGNLAIITGANSGIGFQTALYLAQAGARVIMACRDVQRGQEALNKIIKSVPNASVELMQLDLSDLASVKYFAKDFKRKFPGPSLNLLINNAAIMAVKERKLSPDGLEMQMSTNHLGHFALTGLLFDSLAANARIINHSSSAIMFADPNILEDFLSEKGYNPWKAYGNSKVANLMFTFALNEKNKSQKKNITSIAVHPGYTSTNLQFNKDNGFPLWMCSFFNSIFAMKVEDGSLSQVLAAVSPHIQPSNLTYFGPRFWLFGPPVVTPVRLTWNESVSARFWEISMQLTKVRFLEKL